MKSSHVALVVVCGLFAGCGGSTSAGVDASGSDAGLDGSVAPPQGDGGGADVGAGDVGSPDAIYPLSLSALPVTVTDVVTSLDDGPVSGMILVQRNYKDVTDAVVTINGKNVPGPGPLYDIKGAGLTGLGPTSQVVVVATTSNPAQSQTLTLTCPPALEFTNPAPNSAIAAGKVTTNWSPGIPFDGMRIAGGPMVGFFACYTKDTGNEASQAGHGAWFESLSASQTIQEITAPDCKRYLLELQYPGETVQKLEADYSVVGVCSLQHRVWLHP